MPHHEKEESPLTERGWTKARKVTVPISLEDLMLKKLPVSKENVDMRKLLVPTNPTNADLTRVKQKNLIMDHPKTFSRFFVQGSRFPTD